ncbi:MAG: toll/interleukin-1 receptor domain-containing protein [Nitrospiraceae bacterium]
MSSVFLSHNSKDKPWVRELAKRLTQDGVVVWLDEAELNIGESLIDKISAAIDQMKFVAAVISAHSVQSAWVQKELSLAMSKEIKGRRVTVLPLLIEHCELPAVLRDKLYADFTNPLNFDTEYRKLLRAIDVHNTDEATVASSSTASPTAARVPQEQPPGLRIVGVAKEKTRQDRQYSGLQDYFLQLSAWPPPGWEDYFLEARRFPRHSMWRDAWVEGDCVVIKCALDELGRYHLDDLKQDVETANANLVRANAAAEQRRQREAERIEMERKARDKTLDSLKFD